MRLLVGALAASLGMTACAPDYHYTTSVRLRDPSLVAVTTPDGGAILPIGEASGVIARGTLHLHDGSASDYEVDAVRTADQTIEARFTVHLGLENGERHAMLRPEATLEVEKPAREVVPSGPLRQEELRIPTCVQLVTHWNRSTWTYGTSVSHWGPSCEGNGGRAPNATDVNPIVEGVELRSPWSNVIDVREKRYVDKGAPVGFIFSALMLAGGAALTALAFNVRKGADIGVLGVGLVGVGVYGFAVSIPDLFAHDRTTVLYPPP